MKHQPHLADRRYPATEIRVECWVFAPFTDGRIVKPENLNYPPYDVILGLIKAKESNTIVLFTAIARVSSI